MGTGTGPSGNSPRTDRFRRRLKPAILLLLPLLLAGCLQMERVVQVERDGSGVLIERLLLSNDIVAMMEGMQSEGQPLNVRDDAKLRANAASFGTAVRLVSVRDLNTDFGRGYEARYAFEDINTLRVGQNIEDNMPGDPTAGDTSGGGTPRFTTFTLHRSNPAELVIHWPVDEAEADPRDEELDAGYAQNASTPEQEQMAMEMMKMAFKDMRVAMHVEVMGEIIGSNAMHRHGRRVTLMDIDFGELLSDEAALKAMTEKKPDTIADMKDLMKLLPGLKFEIEPEVVIRFR